MLIAYGNKLNGLSDSIWTFYNDNGNLKNSISYYLDKKNGCAKFYDSLGNVIQEVFYIDNFIQNEKIEYYPTGEIKSIIYFEDGTKIGEAFEYSKTGDIITELLYDDDYLKYRNEINRLNDKEEKTGYWREFYPNGKLKSESNYENGRKIGISKLYDKKGRLDKIKSYNLDSLNQNGQDIELIKLHKEYYPGSYKARLIGGFYNNMKQGMYREYDTLGNIINGYIYKNDTILAEGVLLNDGTYDGEWKFYYSSGINKSFGLYKNGAKNGVWTYYYENGKKQQVGKYNNEIPSGEWKWYYKNGVLKRLEYYRKGKLEGSQIEYDVNGKELSSGEYYNGLREGAWFYNVGDYKEVGEFTQGVKTGIWKYYYLSGKLAFIGEFDEDQPKGKHYYYHTNGVKKLVGKYQAGRKTGVWKSFNKLGEIIEVIKYKRGEIFSINGKKVVKFEINE